MKYLKLWQIPQAHQALKKILEGLKLKSFQLPETLQKAVAKAMRVENPTWPENSYIELSQNQYHQGHFFLNVRLHKNIIL